MSEKDTAGRFCEDCKWFIDQNTCDAPGNRIPTGAQGCLGDNIWDHTPRALYRDRPVPDPRRLTPVFQRMAGWHHVLIQTCGIEARWFEHRATPEIVERFIRMHLSGQSAWTYGPELGFHRNEVFRILQRELPDEAARQMWRTKIAAESAKQPLTGGEK